MNNFERDCRIRINKGHWNDAMDELSRCPLEHEVFVIDVLNGLNEEYRRLVSG